MCPTGSLSKEDKRALGPWDPFPSQRQPHWSLLAASSQGLTVPIPGCLFLPVSFNAPTNGHVTTAARATQALGFLEQLGVQSCVWAGLFWFSSSPSLSPRFLHCGTGVVVFTPSAL